MPQHAVAKGIGQRLLERAQFAAASKRVMNTLSEAATAIERPLSAKHRRKESEALAQRPPSPKKRWCASQAGPRLWPRRHSPPTGKGTTARRQRSKTGLRSAKI